MDYEDLSQAGQQPPAPSPGPAEQRRGAASPGPDQRTIVLVSMLVGLVIMATVLVVVGLPLWIVGLVAVCDLVAMGVLYRQLPSGR